MVQYSAAFIYAATKTPSPIPDFTMTLHLNSPASPETFGIQLNAITFKYWPQFVIEPLIGAHGGPGYDMGWTVSAGTAAVMANYPMPNVDTSYLVDATGVPWVMMADTAQPDSLFFNGQENVVVTQKDGVVTMEITDTAGNVKCSDSWTLPEPLYGIDVEVVGSGGGNGTTFTQFDGTLTYQFDAPVQVFMSSTLGQAPSSQQLELIQGAEFLWGTWADPRFYGGKQFPLYWLDLTGEWSNLWTNILTQTPTYLKFGLSLTQGAQTPNNPPLVDLPVDLSNVSLPALGKNGDFTGITASWVNPSVAAVEGVMFAVVKNSQNQTVAVATGTTTFQPGGATTAVFAPIINLPPSGTYQVSAFVVALDNKPVSESVQSSIKI